MNEPAIVIGPMPATFLALRWRVKISSEQATEYITNSTVPSLLLKRCE